MYWGKVRNYHKWLYIKQKCFQYFKDDGSNCLIDIDYIIWKIVDE